MSVEDTPRDQAQSTSSPNVEPIAPPPASGEQRPSELDEFLARAVDRQIAEQRALRESLQALTQAVRELQTRPAPAPAPSPPPQPAAPAIDIADLDARMKRAMEATAAAVGGELRELRSSVLPNLERAIDASGGMRALEQQVGSVRESVTSLSADVEGIAQALIDLNAGLRDWAEGVDRDVDVVRDAVQQVREVAARAEELQAQAIEAAEERRAQPEAPLLPPEPAMVDVDETGIIHAPAVTISPIEISAEIEQRVKETIELSLYLADQIEAFDKAISNLGDLPTRLEGVISQALKRTLAARAKLDREAETALDEVVATLDEHVQSIGDLTHTAATVRELADGQSQLASGLAAIAEAIDRSSEGLLPRAASSVAKSAKPSRRSGAEPRTAKTTSAKSQKSKPKAKAKPKRKTPARKRKPTSRSAPQGYLEIDAD
jgi:uncharacterized phage infection (PIP) family protein YhgE